MKYIKTLIIIIILLLFHFCPLSATESDSLQAKIEKLQNEVDNVKAVLMALSGSSDWEMINTSAKSFMQTIKEEEQLRILQKTSRQDIPKQNSPVVGSKDPVVTIVEFGSLRCSFCIEKGVEINELLSRYPQKVQFVYKHYPDTSDKAAMEAHATLIAAQRQGKFKEFLLELYLMPLELENINYKRIAKDLGMDNTKFERDWREILSSPEQIIKDVELGDRLKIKGTPAFFINGLLHENFSYESVINGFNLSEDEGNKVSPDWREGYKVRKIHFMDRLTRRGKIFLLIIVPIFIFGIYRILHSTIKKKRKNEPKN